MDKHFNCKEQHFIGYQTHAELYLTQDKMALIDLSDLEECLNHKWSAYFDGFNWYAVTRRKRGCGKSGSLSLHRFLMNEPDGMEIDHLNHDSLDNRRTNLKICNHAENTANKRLFKTSTTGISGITKREYFSKRKKQTHVYYRAQFGKNYERYNKQCKTLDEAIKARKEMEVVYGRGL